MSELPNDYDAPWKAALATYLADFLALCVPVAHAAIDWSRGYVLRDTELQQVARDAAVGRRVADTLVQVWRIDGSEAWVLVHIEIQSQEDATFAQRMFVYHYRLFDRYQRPIVSLAVLGDERPAWRPSVYRTTLWGCELAFHFPVVKLLDYQAQRATLEASRNPFATVILAHLAAQATRQDSTARWQAKFVLTRRLYDLGYDRTQIINLFHVLDWMLQLPEALTRTFWQALQQFEEESAMTYITSIEQLGLERGRQEGRQEGLREGLLQAIALGLEVKFGAAGVQVLPALEALTDVAQLQAIVERLRTATSIDELRSAF